MYEMQLTYTFKFEMTRLHRKMKHLVELALEEIVTTPTESATAGRIFLMATTEEDRVFRYRLPGLYLFYRIPHKRTQIVMTQMREFGNTSAKMRAARTKREKEREKEKGKRR
ncbi:MAG: hypothetical protein VKJ04_09330 [Vampirovibrionales bacterium]|nr:hypothetical protein [Vampirovibrionales bacterium]